MSTQRNREIRRNTSAVMAVLNLALVFLVFAGVHRLETALYDRCVERQTYDAATERFRQVLIEESRSEAKRERVNPFVDAQTRQARAESSMRVVLAGEAATSAIVSSSCTKLRLLGIGR